MTAPSISSLERSLKNCSLNRERRSRSEGGAEEGIISSSSTSDDNKNLPNTVFDINLELNSHISLPCHWEQCLDLKTGEIYYTNRRSGMKAREDPRTEEAEYKEDFCSEKEEEEEEDDDDDDDSSYGSEESSSESFSSSTERTNYNNINNHYHHNHRRVETDKDNVLVVAGCRSCLMYFMVPKLAEDCPRCKGQLLRFDRSESSSR